MINKKEMATEVNKNVDYQEGKMFCNSRMERNGIYQYENNPLPIGNNHSVGYSVSESGCYLPPNICNMMVQNQNGIMANQYIMNQHMNGLNCRMDQVLDKVRKKHKKMTDSFICSNERDGLIFVQRYDDGSSVPKPFVSDPFISFKVTKLSIADGRYTFAIVDLEKSNVVVMLLSEMKPSTVYDAFVECGVRFNACIPRTKISQVLYDFLKMKVNNCERLINLSGYAGWEDGHFKCAKDFVYLEKYKHKLSIPALDKFFDKDAVNMARVNGYAEFLSRIRSRENRLLFALIPFAGVLFTPLIKKGVYEPYVFNLVSLTENVKPEEIAEYFQIFNRQHIND